MRTIFRSHCKYIVVPWVYIEKEEAIRAKEEGTLEERSYGAWRALGDFFDYMAEMRVKIRDELGICVRYIDCTYRTARLVGSRSSPTWRLELAYIDKSGVEDTSRVMSDEDFLKVAKLYLPNHPQCYVSQ